MSTLVLKKWLNPIQWGLHLVQRCLNLVQWHKWVTTIKVIQLIIVEHNVITPLALVSYFEMAIRWIDAKQYTIAERVSAFMTSGLPVMGVPCPAGASVSIGSNQSLPTVGTKPLLPLPSLISYGLRKGSHSCTSKAARATRGRRATTRAKDGWSWEGDEWMKKVGRRILIIFHTKKTEYNIWCNSKWIGEARTLTEAKRKAEAFVKRPRRSR